MKQFHVQRWFPFAGATLVFHDAAQERPFAIQAMSAFAPSRVHEGSQELIWMVSIQ
jgi:hypothetical protein